MAGRRAPALQLSAKSPLSWASPSSTSNVRFDKSRRCGILLSMTHRDLYEDDQADAHDMGPAVAEAQTKKAVLVVQGGSKFWIPQSAIHPDSEVYMKGHQGKLVVHLWWAKARGLAA